MTKKTITSKDSEKYFLKIKDYVLNYPDGTISVDPEFIRLVEDKQIEKTKHICAFDLPVYKIHTENFIALFSIETSNLGEKFIRDFYFKNIFTDEEINFHNFKNHPTLFYFLSFK